MWGGGGIFISVAMSPILSARFEKVMKMSHFVQRQTNALITVRYLREWEICFWKNQSSTPPAGQIRHDISRIFYCRPLQGYAAELSVI
jgi:hypothetical protein